MMVDINKILEGSVAVPYSQEILDCLQSACKSYMTNDSGYNKMEEITSVFLTGRTSKGFKDVLLARLKKKGLNIIVSDSVLIRLSLYSICSCFDSKDEFEKSIRATIFMNYIMVKKGQFSSLPNATYIKGIYQWHISKYLAKKDTLVVGERTKWIENIAKNGFQNYRYSINEEDIKQIHMLVKEASFYRMKISVEEESIQKIKNPYVRVFKGLNAMVNSMEYLYYYFDPQRLISFLIKPEEDTDKQQKLSSVINELRQLETKYDDVVFRRSSVLLRAIFRQSTDDLYGLIGMSFSVREFATYLYYELFIERIINKQSE